MSLTGIMMFTLNDKLVHTIVAPVAQLVVLDTSSTEVPCDHTFALLKRVLDMGKNTLK